ncbi:DUF4377 domain-containing protein [Gelidibacter salicanalis]|uniref:DUF4377 domain-containing protein n=1 Tax=Gelidibacter salicanalis TaxID=291193 RepID=A0A934KJ57_9FLAO|nr:DUF4377 domain-containing protein [Gelidibacter salicanalis]MBJ7880461.1 DUF4377 domain-containing protein [Gelidibacter salicanalis]
MRKLNLLLCFLTITFLSSCSKNDDGDVVKTVEMTVYPETGYGGYVFSQDVYGEFLLFSENDNQEKRILTNGGDFSDNFNYEKGYEYKIEARKIFLKNPPQDGSSIIFEFVKIISKTKVVTQDSEQQIEMEVGPTKVGFISRSLNEIQEALFVKENGDTHMKPLLEIEGFNHEEGYEYQLNVKKIIEAEPYSVKYILVDIVSQEQI